VGARDETSKGNIDGSMVGLRIGSSADGSVLEDGEKLGLAELGEVEIGKGVGNEAEEFSDGSMLDVSLRSEGIDEGIADGNSVGRKDCKMTEITVGCSLGVSVENSILGLIDGITFG